MSYVGYPIVLLINGEVATVGDVTIHENRMSRVVTVDVTLPDMEAYKEFCKEVDQAPSLNHVMFNWQKDYYELRNMGH